MYTHVARREPRDQTDGIRAGFARPRGLERSFLLRYPDFSDSLDYQPLALTP